MPKFIDPFDLFKIQGGASHSTHEVFHAEQTKHTHGMQFVKDAIIGPQDIFFGPAATIAGIGEKIADGVLGRGRKSST